MSYSADIYLQQAGLKSLGFDPGALDGEAGPRTSAARAKWEGSSLIVGDTIAARLVQVAKEQLALSIRETDGKNRGPEIDKLWSATSYPDGYKNREPYCAAGVCWCVREACKGLVPKFALPTTPAAYGFDTWASDNAGKGVLFRAAVSTAKAGDIVVFTFSHVGIVIGRAADGQLLTIEFNTDAAGSRDGGGVYQKTRALSLVRSIHRFTT